VPVVVVESSESESDDEPWKKREDIWERKKFETGPCLNPWATPNSHHVVVGGPNIHYVFTGCYCLIVAFNLQTFDKLHKTSVSTAYRSNSIDGTHKRLFYYFRPFLKTGRFLFMHYAPYVH
jgi:hypothetical protein